MSVNCSSQFLALNSAVGLVDHFVHKDVKFLAVVLCVVIHLNEFCGRLHDINDMSVLGRTFYVLFIGITRKDACWNVDDYHYNEPRKPLTCVLQFPIRVAFFQ